MARELVAFLNFEFRQSLVNIKSVSGDSMTEVPRFAINWRDYQAHLASLGLKHEVVDRPLFRRYLSYLSSEDLYHDLISFQVELRRLLTDVIDSGHIQEAVWKKIFKDANGLPMFIEPQGEGDLNSENVGMMSFDYDFNADTYRIFVLALVRGLILNRRIFSLTLDGNGKFDLPEEDFSRTSDSAAAPTDAERRAALRAAVARDLPSALSRAVKENLPRALAESAAEKLPRVMEALVEAQLPKALAEAVDERVGAALAEAVELNLPEALKRAVAERLPSEPPEAPAAAPEEKAAEETLPERDQPEERPEEEAPVEESPAEEVHAEEAPTAPPADERPPTLSVPPLRFISPSISIPLNAKPETYTTGQAPPAPINAPAEPYASQPHNYGPDAEHPGVQGEALPGAPGEALPPPIKMIIDPEAEDGLPGLNAPDLNPLEYAGTFGEDVLEESLAALDLKGPAAEPEEGAPQTLGGYIFQLAQPEAALEQEYEDIEPEDEDFEDIEPTAEADDEEPMILSERLEEEESPEVDEKDEEAEESGEGDDDLLPFMKVPSKKKAAKVPLEQRLATLEQRQKRRPDDDAKQPV